METFKTAKQMLTVNEDYTLRLSEIEITLSKFNQKKGWILKHSFTADTKIERHCDLVIICKKSGERFGVDLCIYDEAVKYARNISQGYPCWSDLSEYRTNK